MQVPFCATRNTLGKQFFRRYLIFQKNSKKNSRVPNFEIDQISGFCLKTQSSQIYSTRVFTTARTPSKISKSYPCGKKRVRFWSNLLQRVNYRSIFHLVTKSSWIWHCRIKTGCSSQSSNRRANFRRTTALFSLWLYKPRVSRLWRCLHQSSTRM